MKRLLLLFVILIPVVAHAQVSSSTARRVRGGNTPPATCKATAPADVFIDTDAVAASRLLVCTSANTWTAQGAAAGITNSAGSGIIPYTSDGSGNLAASSLVRVDANTTDYRNGVSPQLLRIYNTFTDASNYQRSERGFIAGDYYDILRGAGTGAGSGINFNIGLFTGFTTGNLNFYTNGNNDWQISAAGDFRAVADNAKDIGAAGANRPRTGYFGTSLITPLVNNLAFPDANTVEQRNGTTAQNFNFYGTYAGAGAKEWRGWRIIGGNFYDLIEASGGGTVRELNIGTNGDALINIWNGGAKWQFTGSPSAYSLIPLSNNSQGVGRSDLLLSAVYSTKFCYSATVCDFAGAGTPEGSITAGIGSTYRNTIDGAFFRKTSGAGNTGWTSP